MDSTRMGCHRFSASTRTKHNVSSLRRGVLRTAAVTIVIMQLVISLSTESAADIYTELPPELAKYDATYLVHISNKADAEGIRRRVKEFIWLNGKLPTAKLPASSVAYTNHGALPRELNGIDGARVDRVERLDVHVDFDYHHISFLLHPATASQRKRLVIIHQGHQKREEGMGRLTNLANRMLREGFTVLLMHMPLSGWNTNNIFKMPKKGIVTIREQKSSAAHNQMFSALAEEGGTLLRFFIEPVTVGINYFIRQNPDYRDISMIGLSGGGWATHISAAIDARINLSIPVAGSYPLFLRPYYPGSEGDAEQILPALYRDRASWLDLYILGADHSGRKQIQVLNQYDICCFYGVGSDTYKDIVRRAARNLGGQWECVLDSTHRSHQISIWAIEKVIVPALDESKVRRK